MSFVEMYCLDSSPPGFGLNGNNRVFVEHSFLGSLIAGGVRYLFWMLCLNTKQMMSETLKIS